MNNEQNSSQALQVLKETELCGRQFAVYGTAENPLFRAADVAAMIEHTNPRMMLDVVDDDEKVVSNVYTLGGNQQAWFLTEDGLYEVLMQSRKPIAKDFKRGVKTILKEIRTTGTYVSKTADDEMILRAIETLQARVNESRRQLAIADEVIERQNETISIQQPKADYFDTVMQSETTYNLTEISKDLGFQSVHKFTAWAREHGIIYKQLNGVHNEWMPTSKWSGKGWFTTRTSQFLRRDGSIGSTMQTVVTEQGRVQLHIYQNKISK